MRFPGNKKRLKITHPIPAEMVSGYVDRILLIENYSITTPFSLPLFANGTPTLLFLTSQASISGKATNYLTLFGQTVFPETLKIENSFTLIAYFFRPFSLFPLFGISAKELTDFPVDLELLSAAPANRLREHLLNAATTEEMLSLLDAFILRLISRGEPETGLIKYVTESIAANSSKEDLLALRKEIHITERTFERLFDKNIGVPPSLFRRICQFNAAFQQLNKRRFHKLTDLAFEHGYADQSHFIRVFKEFTHITPKEYLRFGEPRT